MSTFSGSRSARALQENVEKLTGQRGNGLDRAVTLRDLQTLGLASLTRSSNGAILPKPVPQTETGDAAVQRPGAPTNFSGVGGFGAILLEWRLPSYNGHAHTEVWRHTEDVLSAATMIATTPATVFGDIVKPGASYYYWIRHINVNDIEGPYNAEAGTQVSTSENIGDVIDDIGEQMAESQLIQHLQEDIDGAAERFEDMWGTKVQAGDIQAGIGLLATSEGVSQVAVSASQFFVFDPNVDSPNIQPLFAIDQGSVIIPKALIEKATIQILNAQTIVADEVKAGISISTPTLTSAVINGAEVNVGAGGPYNGYNTHIASNGNLYTHYLIASGGRLSNLTIDENCRVLGTIYANQIIGDVVKPTVYTNSSRRQSKRSQGSVWSNIFSISIPAAPFTRTLIVPEILFDSGGYGQPYVRYYINNGRVMDEMSRILGATRASIPIKAYSLPANQTITFRMDGYFINFSGQAYLSFSAQSLLFLTFK
ncbi:phage tail tip fiber protein [Enterovibrio norvegicus]|uniref:phage tail tip fiber protein n=1 Tax=Enterovibrio norvegicus TaxID=188144 RepID=UPI0002FA4F8F|nr:DUF1983 domain-containing protein [Enterovibrio norvegicus]OEF57972.1 hypothetical protein A1OU_07125 [Enterovibrio norvegicus]